MPAPAAANVAIDVTPMLGFRTGIGIAVAEMVAALANNDANMQLSPYALSLRARRERSQVPAGTRFPPIPARVLLAAWQRFDSPSLDRFLRPAQVIHATNYLSAPSRLPTLVSVWDCSFVRFAELATPEVRAFEPALRRALRRGVHIHTASHAIAAEIDDIFGPGLADAGRIHVVPMGIPPSRGNVSDSLNESRGPAQPDDGSAPAELGSILARGRFVLAIGRHEPRKDVPLLVRSFAAVGDHAPDVQLVLAGPAGPDRDAVIAAIHTLPDGTRDRIHLLGAVDDAAKERLLGAASVLCYPSRDEGFGFPILEAMRAGVPVVATATGSIPEVAGSAALLVPPGDELALADAILGLLGAPERSAALRAAGRERAAEFSWDTTARALSAVYRALAS